MTEPTDLTQLSIAEFAAATAGREPTPGGGSVAGVVGALGAALGGMALAFTRGRKDFAQHEQDYAVMAGHMERARGMFLTLVADDVAAYTLYQEAKAAPGADQQERIQLALAAAINVPREMTTLALAVLRDLASLSTRCNRWLISDLAAGARLAEVVVRLCDYNVRVNARGYADAAAVADVRGASSRDCARASELLDTIDAAVRQWF